jgi:formylglycine-generating enzyme required for sulfatase activity
MISVKCDCLRDCLIDLKGNTPEIFCPACGKKLVGHVYVLSNPAMTGLLKIGSTERTVQERVVELNSTGVPVPFEVEAVFNSQNPFEDEQKVHQTLRASRLNSNREFFSVELKDAVQSIIDCLGVSPSYLKNPDSLENDLDKKARDCGDGLFTSEVTGAKFVKIPSGSFLMGSDAGADWEKAHRVNITRSFWMAVTPMTAGQYIALMGYQTDEAKCIISASRSTTSDDSKGVVKYKKNPVVWLSSWDAERFCEKLTLREHRLGSLPLDYQYVLPTEAQWEYACRAGSQGDFYGAIKDVGWYRDNSGDNTHPVGQKRPNNWGLFDMHGNVYEWCRDRVKLGIRDCMPYTDTYYDGIVNPVCDEGPHRIYRGGGWTSNANECKAFFRSCRSNDSGTNYIGFRMTIQRIK